MATKPKRTIIACFSDIHAGHKLGLLHPDTEILSYDDQGQPELSQVTLNPAQEYLWETFLWGQAEIRKLAGDDPVHVLFGGDLTNGDTHTSENFTSSLTNQVTIASDILGTWLESKKVKSLRIVAGTESHIYNGNNAEAMTEQMLKKDYKKDIRLTGHALIDVGGLLVDLAHHGAGGSQRTWLDGNNLRYYLSNIYFEERLEGNRVPDVVLRGHVHVRLEERVTKFVGDQRFCIWGITIPSFQMLTAYARKVTRSSPRVTNGMLALEVVDGRLVDCHWFTRTRDLRSREDL